MRLPVTPQISTKDGLSNKNARLTNCLKESKKTGDKAVVRPGLVLDVVASGVGHGLVVFDNHLVSVYGTTLGFGVNVPEPDPTVTYDGVLGTTPSSAWNGVAWNGTKYCIVGIRNNVASDKCAVSTDGLNWTEKTLPVAAFWSGITVHNGNFVAIGYVSGVAGYSAVSTDNGDNWTLGTISATYTSWFFPISANGVVCVMSSSSGRSAISLDGITWNTYSATGCGAYVAWNGSVFCSPGAVRPIYSTDGQSWFNGTAWTGSAPFFIASDGTSFVACIEFTGDIQESSDGITFTQHTSVLSDFSVSWWQNIIWTGVGYLRIGLKTANSYAVSLDGITWDETAFITGGAWTSYCAGNGNDICVVSGLQALPKSTLMESTPLASPNIPALSTITGDYYDFTQSPI